MASRRAAPFERRFRSFSAGLAPVIAPNGITPTKNYYAGQLYNYVADFGRFLVIVTANSLVEPNKPVVPVNTQKATELLTKSVSTVRGR